MLRKRPEVERFGCYQRAAESRADARDTGAEGQERRKGADRALGVETPAHEDGVERPKT